MGDFVRVPVEVLTGAVCEALVRAGLSSEVARVEAELAVEADLMGVPSHGVTRTPLLLTALAEGRCHNAPQVRLVRDRAAVCVLDADLGPGRFCSQRAMDEAVARARVAGVGACLATRMTHWGRAHAYAAQAARAGMVGICMTNATTSMAGWGATGPVLGNNPLAIAVPGPDPDRPIVLDMAMSQAAVGKIATWLREGRPIPGHWGLDAQGKPTDDAAAVLKGTVLPFGEHKGAALSLMIQLMTAVLAGGALDHDIRAADGGTGLDPETSKLFLALDVEAFTGLAAFRLRAAGLLAWLEVHASSPTEAFLWPGQRGWSEAEANLRDGVPLHRDIAAKLRAAGLAGF